MIRKLYWEDSGGDGGIAGQGGEIITSNFAKVYSYNRRYDNKWKL